MMDKNKSNNDHDVVPSIYIEGLGVPEVYIAVEYGEVSAPRLTINPFTVEQKPIPVNTHRLDDDTVRARPIESVKVIPMLIGPCGKCGEGCESFGLPVLCETCRLGTDMIAYEPLFPLNTDIDAAKKYAERILKIAREARHDIDIFGEAVIRLPKPEFLEEDKGGVTDGFTERELEEMKIMEDDEYEC